MRLNFPAGPEGHQGNLDGVSWKLIGGCFCLLLLRPLFQNDRRWCCARRYKVVGSVPRLRSFCAVDCMMWRVEVMFTSPSGFSFGSPASAITPETCMEGDMWTCVSLIKWPLFQGDTLPSHSDSWEWLQQTPPTTATLRAGDACLKMDGWMDG